MTSKEDKMEEDFSPLVDTKLPEYRSIALDQGQLARAVENLLSLEKQTRTGGDAVSTARILECIVELCFLKKDFKALKENLALLPKRRGQLKQATKRMVQKVMSFLTDMEYDNKMDILQSLLSVTEGKIFLEKQGARLTLMLSKIRESEGKIAEAATILQEVQVETFGSMKKKEKTNYILEQMRLCLRKKDFIRAQIISRKINPRVLDDKDFQEERVKYYSYMVDYWMNERNYLEIYRAFYNIFTTPSVQADPQQWQKALKNCVVFIVLSPYGNEQNDLINRLAVSEEKKLQQIPLMKELMKRFLTMEILSWIDVESRFVPELKQLDVFSGSSSADSLLSDLHVAVTEHNLRTVSKYYSKISLLRLADLLALPPNEAEKSLCDLVIKKSVFARIDRVGGNVNFIKRQDPADVLNDWSNDLSQLLGIAEKTCHLIHRENMIHGIESS